MPFSIVPIARGLRHAAALRERDARAAGVATIGATSSGGAGDLPDQIRGLEVTSTDTVSTIPYSTIFPLGFFLRGTRRQRPRWVESVTDEARLAKSQEQTISRAIKAQDRRKAGA